MSRLTEYRQPHPTVHIPSGHAPITGWTWDGTERVSRRYAKAGSGWTRTAVIWRERGEWRWRVEEHHGVRTFTLARGSRPALFPEMLYGFAELAARTKN